MSYDKQIEFKKEWEELEKNISSYNQALQNGEPFRIIGEICQKTLDICKNMIRDLNDKNYDGGIDKDRLFQECSEDLEKRRHLEKLVEKYKKRQLEQFDKQVGKIQNKLNSYICACVYLRQSKAPIEEIKSIGKKVIEICKKMTNVLEKKHNATSFKIMKEKCLKSAEKYKNLLKFAKQLAAVVDVGDNFDGDEFDKVLEPSFSNLNQVDYSSIIIAQDLPNEKSEKPKDFENEEDYINHIKGKIKIHGSNEIEKAQLYGLLEKWYNVAYDLDCYNQEIVKRRKNDGVVVSTFTSFFNWCFPDVDMKFLKLGVTFAVNAMSIYVSDSYYCLFCAKDRKSERERTLDNPNIFARIFDGYSVDEAIEVVQKEINGLASLLKMYKYNFKLACLSLINRGCGALLANEVSNSVCGFFDVDRLDFKVGAAMATNNALRGFTIQH